MERTERCGRGSTRSARAAHLAESDATADEVAPVGEGDVDRGGEVALGLALALGPTNEAVLECALEARGEDEAAAECELLKLQLPLCEPAAAGDTEAGPVVGCCVCVEVCEEAIGARPLDTVWDELSSRDTAGVLDIEGARVADTDCTSVGLGRVVGADALGTCETEAGRIVPEVACDAVAPDVGAWLVDAEPAPVCACVGDRLKLWVCDSDAICELDTVGAVVPVVLGVAEDVVLPVAVTDAVEAAEPEPLWVCVVDGEPE